ncbi:SGNH/GDSL hydrolase family protein [Streptomyces sp. 900116325]
MSFPAPIQSEGSDPHCVTPAQAAELLKGAPWKRMAVLGDSVAAGVSEAVEGYRDTPSVHRVAEALGAERHDFAWRNFAVRNLRIAEIRTTQVAPVLDWSPDLILVSAGGNDAFRRSYNRDRMRQELGLLLDPFAALKVQIVTIGLFDLARSGLVPELAEKGLAERFDDLDAVTRAVSAFYGGVHVENHTHPEAANPDIFAGDRIHANARGHAMAAANLMKALATVSRRQKSPAH